VADIIKEIDTELTIQEVKNDKRQPKAKKATNADSNEADLDPIDDEDYEFLDKQYNAV